MTTPRILLTEDDKDLCAEVADILRDERYFVDVVHDGNDCMRVLEKNSYDIIILDLKMPGLSGYSILEHVKNKFSAVKVIVITGSVLHEESLSAEASLFSEDESRQKNKILESADAVFNKPFDIEKFILKVKELAPCL